MPERLAKRLEIQIEKPAWLPVKMATTHFGLISIFWRQHFDEEVKNLTNVNQ